VEKGLLLDSFEIMAGSETGISGLHSLLNSLAIREKLGAPSTGLCNMDEFIDELEKSKSNFLKQHQPLPKRKTKLTEGLTLGFDLPIGWGLVPLEKLCYAQAGFAFSAGSFNSEGIGLPLIRIRDIEAGHSNTFYSGEYRPEFLVQTGDWLIGMDGNFTVRQWKGGTALLNQRVTRLKFFDERINQKFVTLSLQEHLSSLMGTKSYTTVDHLSTKQIELAPIPLPCIGEQDQIIALLEKLTAGVTQLGELQKSLRKSGLAARKASIRAISTAQTPEEFQAAWERIQDNWDVIAGSLEAIESMRSLILDLAVRGDLVRADFANDVQTIEWTALELKLDSSKLWTLPTLHQERRHGWNRVPLARIGSWGSGGTPTSSRKDYYQNGIIPWAVIGDLNNGIMTSTEERITEKALLESSAKLVPIGAVLIAMYGASIGKTALAGIECCTNQAIAHCIVDTKLVSKEYFFIVAKSLKRHLIQQGKGAAQPNISQSVLKHLIIDLPPLDEQGLIVERVKSLMQLCELIEISLRESESLAEKLSRSVVLATV
jgi:type I restriction enzyme S subunit